MCAAKRRFSVASLLTVLTILAFSQVIHADDFKSDMTPILRVVDLKLGEKQEVALADGSKATLRLLAVTSRRETVLGMICRSSATLEVNGETVTLDSGNYRLPVTAGGVQIDCPVTGDYPGEKVREFWQLEADARVRIWPAGSPWIEPGTFTYPIRQRWMAAMTWFSNEPVSVVNGWSYYHAGMDFGATEGLTEVVSAIDGIVASRGLDVIPESEPPVEKRADVVYLKDRRGWFYRYSHLKEIDESIQAGARVKQGQRVGLVGKEGSSGGWSHLHFDIRSLQPSGGWGVQDSYAFLWQSYLAENSPKVMAVARPLHRVLTNETVCLDASRSWAAAGVTAYSWSLTDGTTADTPVVERRYEKPGVYSELVKVTSRDGQVDYDFATVRVADAATGVQVGGLDANYHPTQNIKPGDEVVFTSRGRGAGASTDTWDFGDGSPTVSATSNRDPAQHAPDGYARVTHRFAAPGDYFVTVRADREEGCCAMHRLHVRVECN